MLSYFIVLGTLNARDHTVVGVINLLPYGVKKSITYSVVAVSSA